jgi:hypothetical protein
VEHDVFISHSSKDKPIADAICASIEREGIRCWIAPRDIRPGQEWPEAIVNAITISRVMVLIFSTNSNNSKDVAKEITLAMNSNVIVIPFKIDDILPKGVLKYQLADTHWLDAMNPPTAKQIQELVDIVRSLVSGESASAIYSPGLHEVSRDSSDVLGPVTKPIWFWAGLLLLTLWLAFSLFMYVGIWAPGRNATAWYSDFLAFLLISAAFLVPTVYCLRRGMVGGHPLEPSGGEISIWWWAPPAVFGFAGGLISWSKHKRANRRRAVNMLALGILSTPFWAIPFFAVQTAPVGPTVETSVTEPPMALVETPESVIAAANTPQPTITVTPTPEAAASPEIDFQLKGSWPTSRQAHSVFVYGDTAYIANGEDGLVILDVSDPSNPQLISTLPLEKAINVVVADNVAYVIEEGQVRDGRAYGDTLVLIDVAIPGTPRKLGDFAPEGGFAHRSLNKLVVVGEMAYLTSSDRLILVDVSSPSDPSAVGEYSFSSNISNPGVAVADGIAYIQANRLHVIDVRDPSEPVEIGGFDTGWGSSISVVDGTAYIAEWDAGLTILDVSTPSRPVKLGQFKEFVGNYDLLPRGVSSRQILLDVSVSEDIAYVTYSFGVDQGTWMQVVESGIIAIDVSDPRDPWKIAVHAKMDETSSVYATDHRIFATDGTRGLYIFSLDGNLD